MAVIMAQEENTSRCSNSSSGGGGDGDGGGGSGGGSSHRSSKKLKQKKVPQRGMGVAQLEKIILEERMKKQSQSQNQSHGLDHPRFTGAFQANLGGFGYESNLLIRTPPPNLMLQRSQHLQQPCSSSMVNVSAGTSSPFSSSVQNFQMEPPSNQSYYGNNYHPLWAEDEKMVGMKRPYPFLLESGPIPSFRCKFPSASCGNGGTTKNEPAHLSFRENPSSSGVMSDAITMKFIDENKVMTKDFLKLAPPHASQSKSSSKGPQIVQSEDSNRSSGRGGSNLPPFLGFFPAARPPIGQPENSNGEAGGSVDLNLKL